MHALASARAAVHIQAYAPQRLPCCVQVAAAQIVVVLLLAAATATAQLAALLAITPDTPTETAELPPRMRVGFGLGKHITQHQFSRARA